MTGRRRFLATASRAVAAVGAAALIDAPSVIAQPKVQWRNYYYPGWHEPGTVSEFSFNKKAYEALPADLRRTLDHAIAAVQVYGLTDYHAKNAIALERLKAEFKGKIELLQLPVTVLRDLKKLAAGVITEQSAKSPMARRVHASFTKFQALVGPWDRVAEGAYHQPVAV